MSGRKAKRAGRLPAEKAAMIPDRLLDAATALVSEVGYANTTMDAIARKAGASSKTVYSRYANKQEVLEAVVRRLMDRTIAASGVETLTLIPFPATPAPFCFASARRWRCYPRGRRPSGSDA